MAEFVVVYRGGSYEVCARANGAGWYVPVVTTGSLKAAERTKLDMESAMEVRRARGGVSDSTRR